jgi:putative oxidoreductase
MNVDLGLLVLRVAVGGVVLAHGLIKIGWPISMGPARGAAAVRGVSGWFGGLGFWPPMLWALVSIVAEIGGSLLTIFGLGGPIGPGLIFGDMVIVTLVAHWPAGFWAGGGKQMAGVEFPIPLTAGGFAIALIGNGGWSLDAAFGLTYPIELTWAWLGLMVLGDIALLAIRAARRDAAPAATQS